MGTNRESRLEMAMRNMDMPMSMGMPLMCRALFFARFLFRPASTAVFSGSPLT